MGPRDRDDLLHLVGRIEAIELSDQGKASACRELREKLRQNGPPAGWRPTYRRASPPEMSRLRRVAFLRRLACLLMPSPGRRLSRGDTLV